MHSGADNVKIIKLFLTIAINLKLFGVNMRTVNFLLATTLLVILSSPTLAPRRAAAQEAPIPVAENKEKTHLMLGIIGYNYTDRFIDGFSVDGRGGGDVRVSSPTTGGSGTVCCVLFSKKPKWPIQVTVRWQSGGCRVWDKKRPAGHNQYHYKEAIVSLEKGQSIHPTDIAVHFFPDGSVRVRLSEGSEPPLLKLPKEREIDDFLPDCKPGQPVEYL